MSEVNQYQTPNSNVEQAGTTEYGEVKLFAVSGRIGRIRYIAYSFGIMIALMIVVSIVMAMTGMGASDGGSMSIVGMIMMVMLLISYVFVVVISIMLTIQRSHDFNASGWLCLVSFIPLASLIFLFIPGTDGENKYGLKTPPNGAAAVVVIVMVVLIPITGILAAIAIPAYQGYVEQARQVQLEQSQ